MTIKKNAAKPLNLRKLRVGKRVYGREIAEACGLSQAGVWKCFRENRPPKNPIVRKAFLVALGIAP